MMKRLSTTGMSLGRRNAGSSGIEDRGADRARVGLRLRRVSKVIGSELVKIRRKQIHARRVKETFFSNGVGLWMGMVSAQLVSRFFEVRSAHNLWGLFSRHTLVSENTYKVLCFAGEFLVALVAFSLTDHVIDEYRSRREGRTAAELDSDPLR